MKHGLKSLLKADMDVFMCACGLCTHAKNGDKYF